MDNPYKVLGVSSLESKANIKKRYRELSRMYHPDNQKTGNEVKFKEIVKAWETIEKYHKDVVRVQSIWRHKSIFDIYKEA